MPGKVRVECNVEPFTDRVERRASATIRRTLQKCWPHHEMSYEDSKDAHARKEDVSHESARFRVDLEGDETGCVPKTPFRVIFSIS